jgi:hypothetical protein
MRERERNLGAGPHKALSIQGGEMNLLSELISSLNSKTPNFRPTEIYNECWLIKLVLNHASTIQGDDFPLSFLAGSTWFSEGLLPTPFKARERPDPLSESRTNADGVIGHLRIGEEGKADLSLKKDAAQFTVLEAKIQAPLSKGITHAPWYDQAARNVACMAETLALSGVQPAALARLDFIVLAPREAIDQGKFSSEMDPESIQKKVKKRVDAYGGEMEEWYQDHFRPTFEKIHLEALSWEEAIHWISRHKPKIAGQLSAFYNLCLKYN